MARSGDCQMDKREKVGRRIQKMYGKRWKLSRNMERNNGRKKGTRNSREGKIPIHLHKKKITDNRRMQINYPKEFQLERYVNY